MRHKLKSTVIAAAVLFWGPSIGSSGMTDAVPSGIQGHRAAFGWHTDSKAEAAVLSGFETTVFEFAVDDNALLMKQAR